MCALSSTKRTIKIVSVLSLIVFLLVVSYGTKPVFADYATPQRIQYKRATTTGASISVTLDSTPIDGNVIIAVVGTLSAPVYGVSSITETGVTWNQQAYSNYDAEYRRVSLWLGVVGSGASTSITVNLAGDVSDQAVALVCEYSGILTTGYLDKTASSYAVSTTDTTGTTATTTQTVELWVGGIVVSSSAQSSPTNGFAMLDGTAYAGQSTSYLEKIVSSTNTAQCSTTIMGACAYAGCIATFKAGTPPYTPSWNSVVKWYATLNARVWQTPTQWYTTLSNRQWQSITQWFSDLPTRQWYATQWYTELPTKAWQTVGQWFNSLGFGDDTQLGVSAIVVVLLVVSLLGLASRRKR